MFSLKPIFEPSNPPPPEFLIFEEKIVYKSHYNRDQLCTLHNKFHMNNENFVDHFLFILRIFLFLDMKQAITINKIYFIITFYFDRKI